MARAELGYIYGPYGAHGARQEFEVDMRVGIVGLGYVGASARDLFEPVAEVVTWDIKNAAPTPP